MDSKTNEDRDGDGVDDNVDLFPDDPTEAHDYDNDGVGDSKDLFPKDPTETLDNDRDGLGDNQDPDDDNDGVLDINDELPFNRFETKNADGDGVGDNNDQFPTNPTETKDTDGDGVGDNTDQFPTISTETKDTDGDGVGDNTDAAPGNAEIQKHPLIHDALFGNPTHLFKGGNYQCHFSDDGKVVLVAGFPRMFMYHLTPSGWQERLPPDTDGREFDNNYLWAYETIRRPHLIGHRGSNGYRGNAKETAISGDGNTFVFTTATFTFATTHHPPITAVYRWNGMVWTRYLIQPPNWHLHPNLNYDGSILTVYSSQTSELEVYQFDTDKYTRRHNISCNSVPNRTHGGVFIGYPTNDIPGDWLDELNLLRSYHHDWYDNDSHRNTGDLLRSSPTPGPTLLIWKLEFNEDNVVYDKSEWARLTVDGVIVYWEINRTGNTVMIHVAPHSIQGGYSHTQQYTTTVVYDLDHEGIWKSREFPSVWSTISPDGTTLAIVELLEAAVPILDANTEGGGITSDAYLGDPRSVITNTNQFSQTLFIPWEYDFEPNINRIDGAVIKFTKYHSVLKKEWNTVDYGEENRVYIRDILEHGHGSPISWADALDDNVFNHPNLKDPVVVASYLPGAGSVGDAAGIAAGAGMTTTVDPLTGEVTVENVNFNGQYEGLTNEQLGAVLALNTTKLAVDVAVGFIPVYGPAIGAAIDIGWGEIGTVIDIVDSLKDRSPTGEIRIKMGMLELPGVSDHDKRQFWTEKNINSDRFRSMLSSTFSELKLDPNSFDLTYLRDQAGLQLRSYFFNTKGIDIGPNFIPHTRRDPVPRDTTARVLDKYEDRFTDPFELSNWSSLGIVHAAVDDRDGKKYKWEHSAGIYGFEYEVQWTEYEISHSYSIQQPVNWYAFHPTKSLDNTGLIDSHHPHAPGNHIQMKFVYKFPLTRLEISMHSPHDWYWARDYLTYHFRLYTEEGGPAIRLDNVTIDYYSNWNVVWELPYIVHTKFLKLYVYNSKGRPGHLKSVKLFNGDEQWHIPSNGESDRGVKIFDKIYDTWTEVKDPQWIDDSAFKKSEKGVLIQQEYQDNVRVAPGSSFIGYSRQEKDPLEWMAETLRRHISFNSNGTQFIMNTYGNTVMSKQRQFTHGNYKDTPPDPSNTSLISLNNKDVIVKHQKVVYNLAKKIKLKRIGFCNLPTEESNLQDCVLVVKNSKNQLYTYNCAIAKYITSTLEDRFSAQLLNHQLLFEENCHCPAIFNPPMEIIQISIIIFNRSSDSITIKLNLFEGNPDGTETLISDDLGDWKPLMVWKPHKSKFITQPYPGFIYANLTPNKKDNILLEGRQLEKFLSKEKCLMNEVSLSNIPDRKVCETAIIKFLGDTIPKISRIELCNVNSRDFNTAPVRVTRNSTNQGQVTVMSGDGTVIVTSDPVTCVVYTQNAIGDRVDHTVQGVQGSNFGRTVALDRSGGMMAVGSIDPEGTDGRVDVYNYTEDGGWVRYRDPVVSPGYGECSLAFSSDGKVMAVGYPSNNSVKIFDFNSEGTDVITPPDNTLLFGSQVELNADGKTIAITDKNNGSVGRVHIYRHGENGWTPHNSPPYGSRGQKVKLNGDGTFFTVDDLQTGNHKIVVYDIEKQKSQTIDTTNNPVFAYSLDGMVVAVAGTNRVLVYQSIYQFPQNDQEDSYKWESITNSQKVNESIVENYIEVNYQISSLSISADGRMILVGSSDQDVVAYRFEYDPAVDSWTRKKSSSLSQKVKMLVSTRDNHYEYSGIYGCNFYPDDGLFDLDKSHQHQNQTTCLADFGRAVELTQICLTFFTRGSTQGYNYSKLRLYDEYNSVIKWVANTIPDVNGGLFSVQATIDSNVMTFQTEITVTSPIVSPHTNWFYLLVSPNDVYPEESMYYCKQTFSGEIRHIQSTVVRSNDFQNIVSGELASVRFRFPLLLTAITFQDLQSSLPSSPAVFAPSRQDVDVYIRTNSGWLKKGGYIDAYGSASYSMNTLKLELGSEQYVFQIIVHIRSGLPPNMDIPNWSTYTGVGAVKLKCMGIDGAEVTNFGNIHTSFSSVSPWTHLGVDTHQITHGPGYWLTNVNTIFPDGGRLIRYLHPDSSSSSNVISTIVDPTDLNQLSTDKYKGDWVWLKLQEAVQMSSIRVHSTKETEGYTGTQSIELHAFAQGIGWKGRSCIVHPYHNTTSWFMASSLDLNTDNTEDSNSPVSEILIYVHNRLSSSDHPHGVSKLWIECRVITSDTEGMLNAKPNDQRRLTSHSIDISNYYYSSIDNTSSLFSKQNIFHVNGGWAASSIPQEGPIHKQIEPTSSSIGSFNSSDTQLEGNYYITPSPGLSIYDLLPVNTLQNTPILSVNTSTISDSSVFLPTVDEIEAKYRETENKPFHPTWDYNQRMYPVWDRLRQSNDQSVIIATSKTLTTGVVFLTKGEGTDHYSNVVFPDVSSIAKGGVAGISGDGKVAAFINKTAGIVLLSTVTGQKINEFGENIGSIACNDLILSNNGKAFYAFINKENTGMTDKYLTSWYENESGVWEMQREDHPFYQHSHASKLILHGDNLVIAGCNKSQDGQVINLFLYVFDVTNMNQLVNYNDPNVSSPTPLAKSNRLDFVVYHDFVMSMPIGSNNVEFPEGTSAETHTVHRFNRPPLSEHYHWEYIATRFKYTTDHSQTFTIPPSFILTLDNKVVVEFHPDTVYEHDDWFHLTYPFEIKLDSVAMIFHQKTDAQIEHFKIGTIRTGYKHFIPTSESLVPYPWYYQITYGYYDYVTEVNSTETEVTHEDVQCSFAGDKICLTNPFSRKTSVIALESNKYEIDGVIDNFIPSLELDLLFDNIQLSKINIKFRTTHRKNMEGRIYAYSESDRKFTGMISMFRIEEENQQHTLELTGLDTEDTSNGIFNRVVIQLFFVDHNTVQPADFIEVITELFDWSGYIILKLPGLVVIDKSSYLSSTSIGPKNIMNGYITMASFSKPKSFKSGIKVLEVQGDTGLVLDDGVLIGTKTRTAVEAHIPIYDSTIRGVWYRHIDVTQKGDVWPLVTERFKYKKYKTNSIAYDKILDLIIRGTVIPSVLIENMGDKLTPLDAINALQNVNTPVIMDSRLMKSILPDFTPYKYTKLFRPDRSTPIMVNELDNHTGLVVSMTPGDECSMEFGRFEGASSYITLPRKGQIISNSEKYFRYHQLEWQELSDDTQKLLPNDRVRISRKSDTQYEITLSVYYPVVVYHRNVVTEFPLLVNIGDRVFINNVGLEFKNLIISRTKQWDGITDTTRPEIFMKGMAHVDTAFKQPFVDSGAVAFDKNGDSLTVITSGNIDTSDFSKIGIPHTIVYNAVDNEGNSASQVQRKVTLIHNSIPPEITILGQEVITYLVDEENTYTDEGATAIDDNLVNVDVSTEHSVDMAVPGIYTVNYTAVGSNGSVGHKSRIIHIIPMASRIQIEIVSPGHNPGYRQPVILNEDYIDLGVTTHTNAYGDIYEVITTGSVDTTVLGTYTIHYDLVIKSLNIPIARQFVTVDVVTQLISTDDPSEIKIYQYENYVHYPTFTYYLGDRQIVTRLYKFQTPTGEEEYNYPSYFDIIGTYTLYYKNSDQYREYREHILKVIVQENIITWNLHDSITIKQYSNFNTNSPIKDQQTDIIATTQDGITLPTDTVIASSDGSPVTEEQVTQHTGTYIVTYTAVIEGDVYGSHSLQVIVRETVKTLVWNVSNTTINQNSQFIIGDTGDTAQLDGNNVNIELTQVEFFSGDTGGIVLLHWDNVFNLEGRYLLEYTAKVDSSVQNIKAYKSVLVNTVEWQVTETVVEQDSPHLNLFFITNLSNPQGDKATLDNIALTIHYDIARFYADGADTYTSIDLSGGHVSTSIPGYYSLLYTAYMDGFEKGVYTKIIRITRPKIVNWTGGTVVEVQQGGVYTSLPTSVVVGVTDTATILKAVVDSNNQSLSIGTDGLPQQPADTYYYLTFQAVAASDHNTVYSEFQQTVVITGGGGDEGDEGEGQSPTTNWTGDPSTQVQQGGVYTSLPTSVVVGVTDTATILTAVVDSSNQSLSIGTDGLPQQPAGTYYLTFQAVAASDHNTVYSEFQQTVVVLDYLFEKEEDGIFEGEEQYNDPGAFITNNGNRTRIFGFSNNVNHRQSGTYSVHYRLPNGGVSTSDVVVWENPFKSLIDEKVNDQGVDVDVINRINKKSKQSLYDIIKYAFSTKPQKKANIRREYLQYILPVQSQWSHIELHSPDDNSVIDFSNTLPENTGRFIVTTIGESVKLELDRYSPININTYSGVQGQIIKYEGVFKEYTLEGWIDISSEIEQTKDRDSVKITQLSTDSFSVEALKGFPIIFQESSPEVIIVAAKTVSDNTQLYLNNIGCILGSISQTEGYTQETLSSGSMGDPYITTMDGTLYKLPNLHKTYRLLQTSDIIINADVRPLPSSLQEKRKEFVRTHRITDNTHDTEYFMSDVFIQFKGKFILQYDMNMKIKVNTLSSSPDAKVFRSNIRKFFSCKVRGNGWYNWTLITLRCQDQTYNIELLRFDHPQLINGVDIRIHNRTKPKRLAGIMAGDRYRSCVVKKIDSCEFIGTTRERQKVKPLREEWRYVKKSGDL
jgi:hypothetical protein